MPWTNTRRSVSASELGQQPLRLADRVAEERRGALLGGIRLPPGEHVADDARGRIPAVDRQAERRFGDEGVAADRLERRTRRVCRALVVARHDPGAAGALETNLRRAEHVSGRMKADPHVADRQRCAIRCGLDAGIGSEAPAQERGRPLRAEIGGAPRPRVIAVCVGDQRAFHRVPRIDENVAGRTIQPVRRLAQHDPLILPWAP